MGMEVIADGTIEFDEGISERLENVLMAEGYDPSPLALLSAVTGTHDKSLITYCVLMGINNFRNARAKKSGTA